MAQTTICLYERKKKLNMCAGTYGVQIWKNVVGAKDYEVSNLGQVRIKPKFMGWKAKNGYLQVTIPKLGKKFIHILVARAFLGPCPEGKEVNHKNGKKDNADLSNLEYLTRKENIEHAWNTGLRKKKYGEEAPKVTISNALRIKILQMLDAGYTTYGICKILGLSIGAVRWTAEHRNHYNDLLRGVDPLINKRKRNKEEIKNLYFNLLLSDSGIAKHLNIEGREVRAIVRELKREGFRR